MNKIKLSPTCCIICGKSYKTRTTLEKHLLLCELLKRSKSSSLIEEDEKDIPSQRKLYLMLLELGHKYGKMEKKVEELNRLLIKQKKNFNAIDWMTTNISPSTNTNINIHNFHENISIVESDIEFLFRNSFYSTFNHILMKVNENDWPIYGLSQKPNILYIYDNKWQEVTRDMIYKFLNKVQMKISIKMLEWKKKNLQNIMDSDLLACCYDKALVKLMGVNFEKESVFNKIKNMIFLLVKKSYEIEI